MCQCGVDMGKHSDTGEDASGEGGTGAGTQVKMQW